jgi:hypothetical protein
MKRIVYKGEWHEDLMEMAAKDTGEKAPGDTVYRWDGCTAGAFVTGTGKTVYFAAAYRRREGSKKGTD